MEILIIVTILAYMLSTAAYFAYLFLQKNNLQRIGYFILTAGILLHTATIIAGFSKTGHLPVSNLRETLSLAAWAIAGVFLAIHSSGKTHRVDII
jgi:ABC-type transport system involved in cytochrome c biogenesis permease subunit